MKNNIFNENVIFIVQIKIKLFHILYNQVYYIVHIFNAEDYSIL